MKVDMDDSQTQIRLWIKVCGVIVLLGALSLAILIACGLFKYQQNQSNAYSRVPQNQVPRYIYAAFDPEKQRRLTRALGIVASSKHRTDKSGAALEEAEGRLREAIKDLKEVIGADHEFVAEAYSNLGDVLNDKSEYLAALVAEKQALKVYETAFGPEHRLTAVQLGQVAQAYSELERYKDSESMYRRQLAIYQRYTSPPSAEVANSLQDVGYELYEQGNHLGAVQLYKDAYAVNKVLPKRSEAAIRNLLWVGWLYNEDSKPDLALPYLNDAIALSDAESKKKDSLQGHEYKACSLFKLRKYDDSIKEACLVEAKGKGSGNVVVRALLWKGRSECALGQAEKAEATAAEILQQCKGKHSKVRAVGEAYLLMADALYLQNSMASADKMYPKAAEMLRINVATEGDNEIYSHYIQWLKSHPKQLRST